MNWIQQKLMGRYGGDPLGIAMIIISAALNFIPFLPARIVSMGLLVLEFFRMLSKNHYKRSKENAVFMKVFSPIQKFFKKIFRPRADRKTHKVFKCPACKQSVRVPRGKGTIKISCPKCNQGFTKKT